MRNVPPINEATDHHNEPFLVHARHIEHDIEKRVISYQQSAIHKFPFLFLGLSTFGAVAVFYGFEKIIDRTSFLADNPFMILVAGFMVLILTGALYRKLS